MPKSRVMLIGWDAADWKVIRPLLDAGQMPNLPYRRLPACRPVNMLLSRG